MVNNRVGHCRRYGLGTAVSAIAAIAVVWFACAPRAEAQNIGFNAPEVKAVFLFNFAQFVDWPDTAFPSRNSDFVIGILGEDPFGRLLDDVVKGEGIGGRALVVERFQRVEDIKTCHILFLGQIAVEQYAHVFEILEGRPILTVGETDRFAALGGTIRFVTVQNRIRLRVNVAAAKAANLTISSMLLRSVEIGGAGRPR